MELKDIVSRFESPKPNGNNSYMVKCPCHNDSTQSLCISEKGDKILMNCFAGCRPEDITRAIGLEMKDLFSQNRSRPVPQRPPSVEYMYSDKLKKTRFSGLIKVNGKSHFIGITRTITANGKKAGVATKYRFTSNIYLKKQPTKTLFT